jgi:hypothetical protein
MTFWWRRAPRTVALVEVEDGARGVGEDLHLDVPRVDDGLLEVERRVAEGRVGLALRGLEGIAQGRRLSTRLPRPPPHSALTKTGNDVRGGRLQKVEVGGRRRTLEGGSPAARASRSPLLPVRCSTSAGGPMKVMPLAAQASASGSREEAVAG